MEIEQISFDTIDSTNSFAKREAEKLPKDKLTIIVAQEQTGGRGSFDRRWHSPRSKNLLVTFSLFLPPQTLDLPRIGQLFALATFALLNELHLHPLIKWPNDLLIHKKKVAGILTEIHQVGDLSQVVLGLGLNVNVDQTWLSSIDQPATSLFVESKHTWNLEELTEKLTRHFLLKLNVFLKKGFEPFQKELIAHLAYLGQTIRCGEWTGVLETLAPDGAILLRLNDGSLQKISSGDVVD